jgi:hypothetical protein
MLSEASPRKYCIICQLPLTGDYTQNPRPEKSMSVMAIYRQLTAPAEYCGYSNMNYQLVLQFIASSLADFDRLVSLETKLIESLGEIGVVDGHDSGSGTFNIFVLTNEPTTAFTQAHQVILREGIPNEMRSAYRQVIDEDYVILWPSALTEFSVV